MSTFSQVLGMMVGVYITIIGPLVFSSGQMVITAGNISSNAIEIYTDIIADKGTITEHDYLEYINKLAGTGVIYRNYITVERLVPRASSNASKDVLEQDYITIYTWDSEHGDTPTPNGQASGDVVKLARGDIVTVRSVPINKPLTHTLTKAFTGFNFAENTVSISRRIRNNSLGG